MSRYDISAHHGKYYKAMKELGCFDELYPISNLVYPPNLSHEDCVKFREDHPNISRSTLCKDYSGYYRAMQRLNCLDELFPREIQRSFNTLTYEDCLKFKEEHPNLTRKELDQKYKRYLKAMMKFGCLDEFFPNSRSYAEDLTMDDCIKFRKEHPDMTLTELNKHHMIYSKAMHRLGLLDELFPDRRVTHEEYSNEYLISEAKKYPNKRELRKNAYWLLTAIRSHKLQKEAYAHMETLGNRRYRMIYAYEFPDHSVYVGLTFDYKKRGRDHAIDQNSAVNKHIKETELTPVRKSLTDYLPVKEAQKMEGQYVEKYRSEGWMILNVAKTGSTGAIYSKTDYEHAINLRKQGMTIAQIAKQLGVSKSTINYHFRLAGLPIDDKKLLRLKIEQVDDKNNIIQIFNSAKEAANYLNVSEKRIRAWIYSHYRQNGYYLRYNKEEYELKRGKEYNYSTEKKKSKFASKPVCQYTVDGVLVRRYKNIRETMAYGFNYGNVYKVCCGIKKTHKGFVFRFENNDE